MDKRDEAPNFRIFEPGGRVTGNRFPEIALPNITGGLQNLNEPGRPDLHVSNRGAGTAGRIAIPVLNLHKTRLNDPHLWFLGTSDQPGDYRSSGCSACHVVYGNDRDPAGLIEAGSSRNSGPIAIAFLTAGRSPISSNQRFTLGNSSMSIFRFAQLDAQG